MVDLGDGGNLVGAAQVNELHALGGTAHHTQLADLHTDDDARLVDNHQVVVVCHSLDGDEVAGLLGDVQGLHALCATVGDAVVVDVGTLAEALLRDHQDGLLRVVDAHHADDFVLGRAKGDGFHACSGTAHRADGLLVEADSLTRTHSHQHLVVAAGEASLQQLVVLADVDGDDAVLADVLIGSQVGLLDDALLGAEDDVVVFQVFLIGHALHVEVGHHLIVLVDRDEVLDGAALAVLALFGDFEGTQLVALALLGEEQQVVVVGGREDMFDEVGVAGGGSLRALAATALHAVFGQRGALDVTKVRDGDDHGIVGDDVLHAELTGGGHNLCAAGVAIFFFDDQQFVLDDLELQFLML